MNNINVRLIPNQSISVKLKPAQGIKVGSSTVYVFDEGAIAEQLALAEDWATKTDGQVNSEDYSSKAYAIGGTGTETNNSKYWAGKAKEYADSIDLSNYRTAADQDVIDSGKQNTISDLDTIRSGASAGATAIQPGDLSTVATTGAYSDLIGTPTIPTVNNPTITFTQGGVEKGSITLNQPTNEIIALDAGGGGSGNDLFDFKWADHELDDQSWLRADTFSWQDGTVYSDAYDHLVDDIDGITASTETIGGYTVTYYLAQDGHKIILPDQETTATNIYNESGIAWYYILDTENTRFKLPRTKWGFKGLRDNVGNPIDERLPNIKGTLACWWGNLQPQNFSGAFVGGSSRVAAAANGNNEGADLAYFDASGYSSTYQDNAPVQERATQMYLYFYVGEFSQSATEQTAGLNSELFNGKADTDLSNVPSSKGILTESYINGTNWYRIYSDGWCEQGGTTNYSTNPLTINLFVEMRDTNYTALAIEQNSNGGCWTQITGKTTTTVSVERFYASGSPGGTGAGKDANWEVKGYKSLGA